MGSIILHFEDSLQAGKKRAIYFAGCLGGYYHYHVASE